MAMYQNQSRVCVEFLKSSKGIGTRIIKLNYGPQAIPPQLTGRMDMVRKDNQDMRWLRSRANAHDRLKNCCLVQNMWGAFMQECAVLAERHPYVIKPSGKQVGSWALCFSIGERG
jgi:hypothetical protein